MNSVWCRSVLLVASFFFTLGLPLIIGAQTPIEKISELPKVESFMHQGSESPGKSPKPMVTLTLRNVSLEEALNKIADNANVGLLYTKADLPAEKKVSLSANGLELQAVLDQVLRTTGLVADIRSGKQVLIRKVAQDSAGKVGDGKGVISGRVVDSATGKGIGGATVSIHELNLAVTTNEKGDFVLRGVSNGANTVSVKLFGYRQVSQTLNVESQQTRQITFELNPLATALNEIVTTATGKQRRIEVGNDVVKIDVTDILNRAPARSVSEVLRHAEVPGVQVVTASGEPGAPTRIRMRGIGSISQSSDPAVIVDGVWVSADMSSSNIVNKAGGNGFVPNALDGIDPNIIESIEIIRGPSAASLYGHEAANGVIVITTKRGKPGTSTWSYSFARDLETQKRPKFGHWQAYGRPPGTSNDYPRYTCNLQQHFTNICIQDSVIDFNSSPILRDVGNAENYMHNVGVSGGVNAITYNLSVSYQDQTSTARTQPIKLVQLRKLAIPYDGDIVRPSGLLRINTAGNTTFSAKENLSLSATIRSSEVETRSHSVNPGFFFGQPPDTDTILDGTREFDVRRSGSLVSSVNSSLQVNYSPDTWWNMNSMVGIDKTEREDFANREANVCDSRICNPQTIDDGLRRLHELSNILTVRSSVSGVVPFRFSQILSIRPSIGLDLQRKLSRSVLFSPSNVTSGSKQVSGVSGQGSIQSQETTTAGYYLNTTVGLLRRLYFDMGFRSDQGSTIRLPLFSSSTVYPKLASSWLVSDESFFPENRIIGLLRLRGAIGYAAVHPDASDMYGSYRYTTTVVNDRPVVIAELNSIGNNNLVPERSLEVEAGFDTDLINDRVQLGFTAAHKTVKNAIIYHHLPTSSGGNFVSKSNVAQVDNRSIEMNLNGRVIDNRSILLELRATLSNINNIVKEVGEDTRVVNFGTNSPERVLVGYPIGGVWARPILGYGDADQNGFIDVREIILGDTAVYMGWSMPKLRASYGGTFSMFERMLSLSMSMSYVGNHIQKTTYKDNYGLWVVGASLEQQALARSDEITNGTSQDVSEVRLNNMAITYNVPQRLVSRMNFKQVSVSLQGSNLALWTNYRGRDPMVNSTPVGNSMSDNGFTLPIPTRYAFNVRIQF